MASYDEVLSVYLNRLESVPNTFLGAIDKTNNQLWKELIELLKTLEVENGVILNTPGNIAKTNQIVEKMKSVMFNGDYIEGVKNYIGAFDQQAILSSSLYSLEFDNFTDKALYKNVLEISKRATLSLFDTEAVSQSFLNPLKNIMDQNIILKGSYNDMISTLKDYVLGSDTVDAKLSRYVSLYARDSFNIFNSTYAQTINNDIGVEYYEYCCGLVKDSREFCRQRVGNIYSKAEVESWAGLSWQGKNPATDKASIFVYRGGYNCMHTLLGRGKKSKNSPTLNTFNKLEEKS